MMYVKPISSDKIMEPTDNRKTLFEVEKLQNQQYCVTHEKNILNAQNSTQM